MADILAVRNELRLQNWMEIIRECQESGLTNKEFCAQRGITEKTYYYWLRKVRLAAAKAMEPKLVRLEESAGSNSGRMIQIQYGKAELKLPDDVDLQAVTVLLDAGTELLRCLRVYGSPARNRRFGQHRDAAVRNGTGRRESVSVLRQTNRPNQGSVLLWGWIYPAV